MIITQLTYATDGLSFLHLEITTMRRPLSRLLDSALVAGASRAELPTTSSRNWVAVNALARRPTRFVHRCSKRTGRGIDRRSAVQEQS